MPTREEIVKALRCRVRKEEQDLCERFKQDTTCVRCINTYLHDAADLIERQAKEIERLKGELGPLRVYAKHISRQPDCNDCAKKRVHV